MPYTVSSADPGQSRQAILDLWHRNFPSAPAERFDWLYRSGQARGWLLHADDGVVGAAGLMDRTFHTPSGILRAGQAIDLNVDATHRTVGPALSLARSVVRFADQEGYQLIYGFPNAESLPVLKRVGYRFLGDVHRWYKPLRCEKILASRWRNRLAQTAVSAASRAMNTALAVHSRETFYRRPAGIRVRLADRFNASFDALWQTAASQFAWIGQRTAAYLTWRFCQSPCGQYEVFGIENVHQQLLAYLVFSCQDDVAHVNDLFFADAQALDLLLAEFLRHIRHQRSVAAVVFVYLGADFVSEILKRFGFWRRPAVWKAMVHVDPSQSNADASVLLDSQLWYLTRADIDTDF